MNSNDAAKQKPLKEFCVTYTAKVRAQSADEAVRCAYRDLTEAQSVRRLFTENLPHDKSDSDFLISIERRGGPRLAIRTVLGECSDTDGMDEIAQILSKRGPWGVEYLEYIKEVVVKTGRRIPADDEPEAEPGRVAEH